MCISPTNAFLWRISLSKNDSVPLIPLRSFFALNFPTISTINVRKLNKPPAFVIDNQEFPSCSIFSIYFWNQRGNIIYKSSIKTANMHKNVRNLVKKSSSEENRTPRTFLCCSITISTISFKISIY